MMHVRLNTPAWGTSEWAGGLCTLATTSSRSLLQLQREIDDFVQPWHLHPYLVSSARSGLVLAIRSLGLERPRMAVPAYVCPSVLEALAFAGAESVFIDTETESVRFNQAALRACLRSGRIDAILAPNTYGLDQDIATLCTLGVPLIDDAAYQAGRLGRPAQIPCGLRGAMGVWSFNFKSLCSTGGGVVFAAQLDISKMVRPRLKTRLLEYWRFADYALRSAAGPHIPRAFPGAEPPTRERPRKWHIGPPAGMTEIQAAIALAQWRRREALYQRQRANADALREVIAGSPSVRPMMDPHGVGPVHFFPIILPRAGQRTQSLVRQFRIVLYDAGVQSEDVYPLAVDQNAAPNAADLAARVVLIPCSAGLSARTMRTITAAVSSALARLERAIPQVPVN